MTAFFIEELSYHLPKPLRKFVDGFGFFVSSVSDWKMLIFDESIYVNSDFSENKDDFFAGLSPKKGVFLSEWLHLDHRNLH